MQKNVLKQPQSAFLINCLNTHILNQTKKRAITAPSGFISNKVKSMLSGDKHEIASVDVTPK